MKTKKQKDSDSSYLNYEHFARTYLFSAKLLLRSKKNSDIARNSDESFRLNSGFIYIPIIYLVRHSIEIFLKSISVGRDGNYSKIHDLSTIREELGDLGIDPEKQLLFQKTIDKYMSYKFSINLLDIDVSDISNEVFRFPDTATGAKIIGENLSKIKEVEILEDITFLSNLFTHTSIRQQLSGKYK